MDKRSCRECGGEVLILPCADLGSRRVAFEVFEAPVASLPDVRQAWAYLRHRGVVRLAGAVPGPGPGVAAAPLRSERLGPAGSGRRWLVLTGPTGRHASSDQGGTAAREGNQVSQSQGRPLRLSPADIVRWHEHLLPTATCHVWMGAVGQHGRETR